MNRRVRKDRQMPDYVIREANDEDGAGLAKALADAWAQSDGARFDAADHPYLGQPAGSFADAGGRLWVVVRDGEVSGALGVLPGAEAEEFEIPLFGLETQSRGQGLATAMLAGADAFAAASGARRIGLWIDLALSDGVRFVERAGFVREPGVRARHDGTDAIEARFTREVGQPAVSPPPSEAPPIDDA